MIVPKNLYFTFVFSISILSQTSGQQLNFDSLILSVKQIAPEFEDYLVQLAWENYPTAEILDSEQKIATQEIKNERLGWTRALGVHVGVNQQTNQVNFEGGGTGLVFFPRISYGLSLNITPLITTPGRVKVAREKLEITEHNVDQEKLRIRSEVKQRFQNYLFATELQKVRMEAEQDADSNYQLLLAMFKNDEASFQDYNDAYIAFSKAKEEWLEANSMINLAKIMIEEYIGVDFEEAQRLFFGR